MKRATRLPVIALGAVLVLAGCSDDGTDDETAQAEEFDVTVEVTSYPMTLEAELAATGPAVDDGLLCAAATQTGHTLEHADGTELPMTELDRLNSGTEPFSYVAIGEYDCDDDSGSFTFRMLTDVEDPSTFTMTSTWELTGGDGYEGVSGEGQNHGVEMSDEDGTMVMIGNNTGIMRSG